MKRSLYLPGGSPRCFDAVPAVGATAPVNDAEIVPAVGATAHPPPALGPAAPVNDDEIVPAVGAAAPAAHPPPAVGRGCSGQRR
jgi:hypothetical protein